MTQARRLVLLLWGSVWAWAQLPPSEPLPESDAPLFRAEIARIDALLPTAPDKPAIGYEMARTWAFGKQWPEAMEWLGKVAGFQAGFDPSRDAAFAELRDTREFADIMAAVRKATPPVSHSLPAFQVREGDLVPESMAYDPKGKQFYFGSMRKGKVLRCSGGGECTEFVSGLGLVLGLKANGDGLWVLSNSDGESALIRYELRSGRGDRPLYRSGSGHSFNDLTMAATGDIYLTDTAAGAVWRLAKGAPSLARLPGRFEAANGIALSSNGKLLYVATFPDGIMAMDLKTGTAVPLKRPGNLSLAFVDGLYCHRGALIAIQNGYMSPRVVRLKLARGGHGVERLEILERRNPGFDGITTGVIAGGEFFYMSNIQDEKKAGFEAIRILRLHL